MREGFVASGADRLDLRVLDLPDPWDGFSGRVLPHLPDAEPPPEKTRGAALEAARTAAITAAAPEAVSRAAARHPEVRAKVEQHKRSAAADGEDNAVERTGPLDQAGAMARRHAHRDGPKRDAVADAPAALAGALEEHFVETWINGGDPSGVADPETGVGTFDVSYVSGKGVPDPAHLLIEASTGESWQLEEGFIQSVILGGEPLPGLLVTLLDQQGITDPSLFAEKLLMLFEHH